MNKACNNIYEQIDEIATLLAIESWMKNKDDLLIIKYIDELYKLKKDLTI